MTLYGVLLSNAWALLMSLPLSSDLSGREISYTVTAEVCSWWLFMGGKDSNWYLKPSVWKEFRTRKTGHELAQPNSHCIRHLELTRSCFCTFENERVAIQVIYSYLWLAAT